MFKNGINIYFFISFLNVINGPMITFKARTPTLPHDWQEPAHLVKVNYTCNLYWKT